MKRLLALSGDNRLVLAEALVALAVSSLAIKLLPFRRTAKMMSGTASNLSVADERSRKLVAQCRWAVLKWEARVPWRTVCFQKGLALHLMLRRRGLPSVLQYGVAQGGAEGLRAHVWITVGDDVVLGGEEAAGFTRVASFPPPAKSL